jgi:hypothetical protein
MPVDDASNSMIRTLRRLWTHAAVAAGSASLLMPVSRAKLATRTGGPDDDEDDELRRLMPVLAVVIVVAAVFS